MRRVAPRFPRLSFLFLLFLSLTFTNPVFAKSNDDWSTSRSGLKATEQTTFVNYGRVGRPAIVRSNGWYARDFLTNGTSDNIFAYGSPSAVPLMCDWDGDGTRTPGVFDNGVWYLRNSNSTGTAHLYFSYGLSGDIPICGDWNGDGKDTIGVVRNAIWYLRNTNMAGNADLVFGYGVLGDKPVVGDWDGNGSDTVGIVRDGIWFLRYSNSGGPADNVFGYGIPSDIPLVGDWNGDNIDTIGIFRDGAWMLRNSNTGGFYDILFLYGVSGDKALVWKAPNFLGNANFEAGTLDGWQRWSSGNRAIVQQETYANHTPGTSVPGTSNPLSAVTRFWDAYVEPDGEAVALYQNVIDKVQPGSTYRLRAWVSHSGITAKLQWWSNVNGGTTGLCGIAPSYAVEPVYAMISCEFTVPIGTTSFNVQMYNDGIDAQHDTNEFFVTDDWSLTLITHYDRATAVDYADMWAKARNLRYGDYGVNDCTNYISQILEAGGYYQRGTDGLSNFAWFHRESPQGNHIVSNTWTVAHWLNEFLTNQDAYASEFDIRGTDLDAVDQLNTGDLFLMRLLNPPPTYEGATHARIIAGYGSPEDGTTCPDGQTVCLLASQHTTDRYRVPAKYNLTAGTAVWVWRVTW